MVLADTSVWISHFREGNNRFSSLLLKGEVLIHPYVIGELACGNLKNRSEILSLFKAMPTVTVATHEEVLEFIESAKLQGQGLGYIDIHLLASARLSDTPLWTLDRKLDKASAELGVRY